MLVKEALLPNDQRYSLFSRENMLKAWRRTCTTLDNCKPRTCVAWYMSQARHAHKRWRDGVVVVRDGRHDRSAFAHWAGRAA